MFVRNTFLTVFQHERNMQCISRTPYASLAIDKSFQTFLNVFSSHIEPADRLLFAIDHAYICLLLVRFGYRYERNSLRSDFYQPFTVRLSLSNRLELEVVNCYLCFRYRLRIQNVIYRNPQLIQ